MSNFEYSGELDDWHIEGIPKTMILNTKPNICCIPMLTMLGLGDF